MVVEICQKFRKKREWCLEGQVLFSESFTYIQKDPLGQSKSEQQKDNNDNDTYQEGDHMTNSVQWSKRKVVALQCCLPNMFELCARVLLFWRYEIKDSSM